MTTALAPGESRLRLEPGQQNFVSYLIQIASENPQEFGGTTEGYETRAYRKLCQSLKHTLTCENPVLTKSQREFLHTVLEMAQLKPAMFGGERKDWFRPLVRNLTEKLPPRGAGCY